MLSSGCSDGGGSDGLFVDDQPQGQPGQADTTQGQASNWAQASTDAHLKSSVTDSFNGFGHSVSLSADGNTLAVSAVPNFLSDIATIEFYARDEDGQWQFQDTILQNGSDTFGDSVKFSEQGNRLLVTDPGISSESYVDAYGFQSGVAVGAFIVYDKSATGIWELVAGKYAPNRRSVDHFGQSAAISADGRLIVASAPDRDFDTLPDNPDDLVSVTSSGTVFVYVESSPGDFELVQRLRAPFPKVNHQYGRELALSSDGSTLVVLTPGDDSGGSGVIPTESLDVNVSANSGVLHVYTRNDDGQFVLQANLKSSLVDADPGSTTSYDFQGFGRQLAISANGNTIVAGSTYSIYNAGLITPSPESIIDIVHGEVTVFLRDNSQWRVSQLIKAPEAGRFSSEFGDDIVLSPDAGILAVGMAGFSEYDNDGSFDAGAAFIYALDNDGQYRPQIAARLPVPQRGQLFGKSLAMSEDGRWLVAGASEETSGGFEVNPQLNARPLEPKSGAVYVYDMNLSVP